jgi:hypothetical protein
MPPPRPLERPLECLDSSALQQIGVAQGHLLVWADTAPRQQGVRPQFGVQFAAQALRPRSRRLLALIPRLSLAHVDHPWARLARLIWLAQLARLLANGRFGLPSGIPQRDDSHLDLATQAAQVSEQRLGVARQRPRDRFAIRHGCAKAHWQRWDVVADRLHDFFMA